MQSAWSFLLEMKKTTYRGSWKRFQCLWTMRLSLMMVQSIPPTNEQQEPHIRRGAVLKTEGIGVGGAIDLGHQHFLNKVEQPFVSVVMAGDGQMDPHDLHEVVQPIVNGIADHVKGN